MEDDNKVDNVEPRERWKSRAIVFRSSDDVYNKIVSSIELMPDCYLVFSKSSNLKLVIKEEGW